MLDSNKTLENLVLPQSGQQATHSPALELKDIKPLLEIPDSSYYIYWGLIIFGIVLVTAILFFVLKKYLEIRRENLAKKYLAQLHSIDWKDAKASAYKATYYARALATDDRRRELFEQLVPMLDRYKYKKEVDSVDEDTLKQFNLYVQVADESV
ncbi:hypothetical protein MNB_SV-6-1628 [hydrothermal vent metagenome]|uniref:DUF4381 domain-containing protein n=1 Tax=hydrothermal vent metagenome TaxID=652676 RepID=A0A1W1BQS5_9ZZZZ